jgi:hypothetical protein
MASQLKSAKARRHFEGFSLGKDMDANDEHQRLLSQFKMLTGLNDDAAAVAILTEYNWVLETAVDKYLTQMTAAAGGSTSSSQKSSTSFVGDYIVKPLELVWNSVIEPSSRFICTPSFWYRTLLISIDTVLPESPVKRILYDTFQAFYPPVDIETSVSQFHAYIARTYSEVHVPFHRGSYTRVS